MESHDEKLDDEQLSDKYIEEEIDKRFLEFLFVFAIIVVILVTGSITAVFVFSVFMDAMVDIDTIETTVVDKPDNKATIIKFK